jgi:VanZ family protein
VAPLSLLGSIALPRLRWQDWTAYALIGAIAVELFQGVFLPGRSASFSDIVANAVGALLGALVYRCAVWFSGRTAG